MDLKHIGAVAGQAPTKLSIAARTTKEIGRHARHVIGMQRRASHLQPGSLRDRFSQIYRHGVWQMGEATTPLSGNGSTLTAAAHVMMRLPGLLDDLGCSSLLDVGCGDMTWMSAVNVAGYIGADIVPAVVAANEVAHPDRTFRCLDAVRDPLPCADAALCREVLFHLSLGDARALLQNVRAAGIRWLIATTDSATLFNADIVSADFRLLNLARAPFGFPAPIASIADDVVARGRTLSVWRVSDLPL